MPTSITAAPGLIQSPRTNSGLPIATTRMSAVRQSAGRSRVREWAMVTVQSARSSSCATGRPTRFERPITTAVCAGERRPGCRAAASTRRAACRARESRAARRRDRAQPADIDGMEAVDILGRIDRQQHVRGVDVPGQRQLHQDAVHAGIGVEPGDQRQQVGLASSRSAGDDRSSPCRARPRSCPCCGRRPGLPDRRRPGPSPGRASRLARRPVCRRPSPRARAGRRRTPCRRSASPQPSPFARSRIHWPIRPASTRARRKCSPSWRAPPPPA